MSDKKKIYKPKPVSGFPEWLPEIRRVEQQWFDHIRRVFESYGFCSIETPSVETLDALNAKGGDGGQDVDKEVYVIERLHKDEGDKESRLALHFDQTVPLARYTAQHFNDLVFPFKRYQMQRVWRGERPQSGRFREFYQCDIDVINVDHLPIHFDAEMPAIIWEILSNLEGMDGGKGIQIRISNRKILMGMLNNIGICDTWSITHITRCIDKLQKIGFHKTLDEIGSRENVDINPDSPLACDETYLELRPKLEQIVRFCENKYNVADELEEALKLNEFFDTTEPRLKSGLDELISVIDNLSHLPKGAVVADLSIVRGLDYYTGTVYETVFIDDPSYGSICSGGRYDDLAGHYINKHLPGVGISIGFSRLFERMRVTGKLNAKRISPADVLVAVPSDDRRGLANETAQILRGRGYNVEVFHSATKVKKQLAYAEKKGIPHVWFPPFEDGLVHEVKDLRNGEQVTANAADWMPHDS